MPRSKVQECRARVRFMRLRTRHPLDQAQTQTRRNTSRTRLLFGRRDQQEHDACHHRKKEHQGNCRAFHRLTLCGLGAIRDPLAANQTAGGTTQPESPSLPFGSTSEPPGISILPKPSAFVYCLRCFSHYPGRQRVLAPVGVAQPFLLRRYDVTESNEWSHDTFSPT